jgi:translation initiation factor 1
LPSNEDENIETLIPAEQKLKIKIETKHRAGKTVTLIEGFIGSSEDKEALVKQLKNHCGTGGASKDGEMLVQGDHREKILSWLIKQGYKNTKKI